MSLSQQRVQALACGAQPLLHLIHSKCRGIKAPWHAKRC